MALIYVLNLNLLKGDQMPLNLLVSALSNQVTCTSTILQVATPNILVMDWDKNKIL